MTIDDFPANAQAANCRRDDIDTNLFFPPTYTNTARIDRAKKVCDGCPLLDPCLDYSLRYNVQGVWAATTEKERAALRLERGIRAEPLSFGPARSNTESIRRMYRQGRTIAHIAERLDVSYEAVRQTIRDYEARCVEQGRPLPRPSDTVPCPDCGKAMLPASMRKHLRSFCPGREEVAS